MSTMRAMTLPEAGGRLQVIEQDLPAPGPHEVLLRVIACGVCHSDAVTVDGRMPGIRYPRIPGHEVIGIVEAIGADVEGWTARDARRCGLVQRRLRLLRPLPSWRGVRVHQLARAPPASAATAAMPRTCWRMPLRWRGFPRTRLGRSPRRLLCAGITTFNALRHCGARAGELVAIHGVGGLGHLGIQFAARLGFAPSRSAAAATRRSWRAPLARTTTSTAERGDPAAALRAWAARGRSSPP